MSTKINALHKQGLKALQSGQIQQAHALLVELVTMEPSHADGYFLLAMVNLQVGQVYKAIALINKAVSFESKIEYSAHLAKCYALIGDLNKAKCTALSIKPSAIQSTLDADTLGVALSHVGLHQDAMAYFQHALALSDTHPQFFYNFGVSAKFLGRFIEAENAFEQAIKLNPQHHQAHFALADLTKVTDEKNHIERLTYEFNRANTPDPQMHLGHALAKEYQDLSKFDAAFTALTNAKQAKHQQNPFDNNKSSLLFNTIKTLSQHHSNEQTTKGGHNNHEPIFVLGMPRSGTTLVERILSSHSEVLSAGELQDFGIAVKKLSQTTTIEVLDPQTIEAIYSKDFCALGRHYIDSTRVVTGTKKHFIDKLPFNFYYVDLIRKALPNAKIICLLRNPLDTCIGNYRQLFSINNPYYSYSLDLMDTAKFYAEFYSLTQHWHTLHSSHFKLLNYEDLVVDPEQNIRALLEFCQLDYQPNCLEFHLNDAPVSTASKVQVRQPLNKRAIGRWKQFKPHTDAIERYFKAQGIL